MVDRKYPPWEVRLRGKIAGSRIPTPRSTDMGLNQKPFGTRASALDDGTAGIHRPMQNADVKAPKAVSQQMLRHHPVQHPIHRNGRKPLRVMKFGGTSVGAGSSIQK